MYSVMLQAEADWVDNLEALRVMFGEKVTTRLCWRCSGTASNTQLPVTQQQRVNGVIFPSGHI